MFITTLFQDPLLFFRIVVILIISISLHELAHGYAALSQGDDTPQTSGHMTLNPVVHMGWESIIFLCIAGISWGQMPVNPAKFRLAKWSNMIVSAAGPFLNFALGLLSIALIILLDRVNLPQILSPDFLYLAARINLMLCLFNLLPVPPLDGFHVFSEIFPVLKPLQGSPFGLFALMILFITPGFGEALIRVADLIISQLIQASMVL